MVSLQQIFHISQTPLAIVPILHPVTVLAEVLVVVVVTSTLIQSITSTFDYIIHNWFLFWCHFVKDTTLNKMPKNNEEVKRKRSHLFGEFKRLYYCL